MALNLKERRCVSSAGRSRGVLPRVTALFGLPWRQLQVRIGMARACFLSGLGADCFFCRARVENLPARSGAHVRGPLENAGPAAVSFIYKGMKPDF